MEQQGGPSTGILNAKKWKSQMLSGILCTLVKDEGETGGPSFAYVLRISFFTERLELVVGCEG